VCTIDPPDGGVKGRRPTVAGDATAPPGSGGAEASRMMCRDYGVQMA